MSNNLVGRPLGARAVLQIPSTTEETLASGLIIPEHQKEQASVGVVVAVGEVEEVSLGDSVMYSRYAGSEYKTDTDVYVVVKEEDILMVLNNKEANNG